MAGAWLAPPRGARKVVALAGGDATLCRRCSPLWWPASSGTHAREEILEVLHSLAFVERPHRRRVPPSRRKRGFGRAHPRSERMKATRRGQAVKVATSSRSRAPAAARIGA